MANSDFLNIWDDEFLKSGFGISIAGSVNKDCKSATIKGGLVNVTQSRPAPLLPHPSDTPWGKENIAEMDLLDKKDK